MYKLIKMTRMLRMLKIVKERSKLLTYLNEILRIGLGFERLVFFSLIFFAFTHILSCIWVISLQFTAEFNDDSTLNYKNTWLQNASDLDNLTEGGQYVTAFYYTIQVMTTVGFGDLSSQNTTERNLSILIMMIGVISFTFATGSLSSILHNYDHANAKLQERIAILNRIFKEHFLPLELYEKLRKAVKYDFSKNQNDVT